MTDAKPGCIHPDSACGNDLLKLGLLAAGIFWCCHRITHHRRLR